MDETLLGVILVVAAAVSIAVAAWLLSWHRERNLVQQTEQWLPVEAKIESGGLEGTHDSGKTFLPTFAFSYQVSGEYYSGRFSLMPKPFPSKATIELLIGQMIGRKLLLRYHPDHPEVWFITDEFIEGLKVEQKIGAHVLHSYYPNS